MAKGITVGAWDPHLDNNSFPKGVQSVSTLDEAQDFDMVVLVTAHKACLELDWQALLGQMRTPLLYDGRRVLDLDTLKDMGWKAYAVGRPLAD